MPHLHQPEETVSNSFERHISCLTFLVVALTTGCNPDESTKTAVPTAQPRTKKSEPEMPVSDPEIAQLNEAIRKNPKSSGDYARRASAWHARNRFDLAFPDFDEAIRLDPTNSYHFDNRGFAYHMNNRQEEKALADYAEAIRLDPDNHHALNNRAYLLATTLDDKFRDGKKALEDARKACEMTEFKTAGYLDTLAVAYAEVGDFEQAIKWQKKALDDPVLAKEWGENMRKQLRLFKEGKPYRE